MLSLNLPNNTTSNNFEWVIRVKQGSGTPAVRYDLTYYQDVGPSLLSGSNKSRAAAGSVDVQLLALKQKMGMLPAGGENKQLGAGRADEETVPAEIDESSDKKSH